MTFTEAKNYLLDRFNYETELYSVMAEGIFVQSDLVEFDFETMIFVAEDLSHQFNLEYNIG